jgi:hypothetical protein
MYSSMESPCPQRANPPRFVRSHVSGSLAGRIDDCFGALPETRRTTASPLLRQARHRRFRRCRRAARRPVDQWGDAVAPDCQPSRCSRPRGLAAQASRSHFSELGDDQHTGAGADRASLAQKPGPLVDAGVRVDLPGGDGDLAVELVDEPERRAEPAGRHPRNGRSAGTGGQRAPCRSPCVRR